MRHASLGILSAAILLASSAQAADVAAGRGPRERRWDRRVDGDPYRDVDAANSQAVRRRLERRERRRRGRR